MVSLYAECGCIASAEKVFGKLSHPNDVTWNALVTTYFCSGDVVGAGQAFDRMLVRNITTWNLMLAGYMKGDNLDEARILFREMERKDQVSWITMIVDFASHVYFEEAFGLFRELMGERISVILQNITSLLMSFIIGFIIEWRVAFLILATFPLIVPANFAQQLSLKDFARDTAKAHAKTSMIVGEGLSNIRTVAVFNAQSKILFLFQQELRITQRYSLGRSQISGSLFGLSKLALYGLDALILWHGAHHVRSETSTLSRVMKVFVAIVNSVVETVSLAPEIVCTYARQSQALVGTSGSGKSFVIALIDRFYDLATRNVMLDGKDIRRLNLKSLRLKIGLVQQEPMMFARTIFDNIASGN